VTEKWIGVLCVLLEPVVGVEQLFCGVACVMKLGHGWPASLTQGFKDMLSANDNYGMQIE